MDLKKIFLIIFVAVILVMGISAMLASNVSRQNSTFISGHFRSLRKDVTRGSVSYSLYLDESNDYYKISAEWAHCFLAESFRDSVRPGQPVQLYLAKAIPFFVPMVAELRSEGISYLSMACVNNTVDEDRYKIPLLAFGCSIFAIGLYALRKVSAK